MSQKPALPPPPSPDWAYYLDFDGTLVEIAERPDAVRVSPALLGTLARLTTRTGGAVAIVTGRALVDIDRLLHPVVLPAAGQHGLEWRMAGRSAVTAAADGAMIAVRAAVADLAARDERLLVENKPLTVALHYRQAPDREADLAAFAEGLVAHLDDSVALIAGKAVFEFRPAGTDKGTAITAFQKLAPFAGRIPVFIGDDRTDEDGFASVNTLDGISIAVGDKPGTAARFALPDVGAVHSWLAQAVGPG